MSKHLVRFVLLLFVLSIMAGCAAPASPAASTQPDSEDAAVPADAERPTITFWMNFNFEESVNELVRQQVQEWADANDVEVDILIAPDTDLVTKWSAGMEAPETLPDVSVVFAQWFPKFIEADLLLDVSAPFQTLDGMAGGFFPAAAEQVTVDGKQFAVPYIGSVTPAYWRTDKLEAAGLSEPPATYDEVKDFCAQVNEPGVFWCYGFGFGGFSDNEVQLRNLIWSYGGKVVEEDGTTIAINSPETLAVLEWIQEMNEMGSFPPDAIVGDDASNNKWYQTGVTAMVVNTGSILSWLRQNDEELLNDTLLTASPAGPAGRHASGGFGAVLGAFNSTEHPELARSLIEHFSHPDQVWARSEAVNFGNLPVHQDAAEDPVWDDPYLRPFIDQLNYVHAVGWPGPPSTAAYEVQNQLVLTRMVQRLLQGEQSPEETLAQAEEEIKQIFAEFSPTAPE